MPLVSLLPSLRVASSQFLLLVKLFLGSYIYVILFYFFVFSFHSFFFFVYLVEFFCAIIIF